jgi:hypothetical protein
MKRMTPSWLSSLRKSREAAGNRNASAPGDSIPSKEGPRMMPATISPMTDGCLILRKNAPTILVATRMTTTCMSRMLRGCRKFSASAATGPRGGASGCGCSAGVGSALFSDRDAAG